MSPIRSVRFFQLVPAIGLARVGDDDLRVFLEDGGEVHHGDVFLRGREGLQQIAAHVEIHPAGQHQGAVVHLGATRHDGDVEAAFGIGAIGDRLIEAAVFGLGDPVCAKADFGQVLSLGCGGGERQSRCAKKSFVEHGIPPGFLVLVLGESALGARCT